MISDFLVLEDDLKHPPLLPLRVGVSGHPSFGRTCVPSIRYASTGCLYVRGNSPKLQTFNEMRAS